MSELEAVTSGKDVPVQAEPLKVKLADEYEDEAVLRDRAVEWVLKEAQLEGSCPVCSARMGMGRHETDPQYLREHLKTRHSSWCVRAEAQRSMDPIIRNDKPLAEQDFFELGGIERVEELDKFDALYVDKSVREAVTARHSVLRWASPDKVRRYLDQGATTVHRGDTLTPRQGSTEDSTVRANEMVLIEIPEALANRRRKQKEQRIERQLYARAEDIQRAQDSTEKAIFDGMLKQGSDRDTAAQVARAIAHGEQRRKENWRGGDPRAHQGMTITDQHGKKTI